MEPQLTFMKGPLARGEERCTCPATTSLPTPVSPKRSTGESVAATFSTHFHHTLEAEFGSDYFVLHRTQQFLIQEFVPVIQQFPDPGKLPGVMKEQGRGRQGIVHQKHQFTVPGGVGDAPRNW